MIFFSLCVISSWERVGENVVTTYFFHWLPARFCWFSLFFIFFRILFSCCFPILYFLAPMAGCILLRLLLLLHEFMYVGNIAYIGMCGIFKKQHSHMAAVLTEVCCCCCFFHKICTKFTNCKYRSRLPASQPAKLDRLLHPKSMPTKWQPPIFPQTTNERNGIKQNIEKTETELLWNLWIEKQISNQIWNKNLNFAKTTYANEQYVAG